MFALIAFLQWPNIVVKNLHNTRLDLNSWVCIIAAALDACLAQHILKEETEDAL